MVTFLASVATAAHSYLMFTNYPVQSFNGPPGFVALCWEFGNLYAIKKDICRHAREGNAWSYWKELGTSDRSGIHCCHIQKCIMPSVSDIFTILKNHRQLYIVGEILGVVSSKVCF